MVLLGLNWLRARWLKILVHAGALLPLAWIAWQYVQGSFLVDPVREITTLTGRTALILLVLTLACTPVNTLFGFKQALRVRRALGLYAFLYASLHFATFVWLDYGFDLELLVEAVFAQRYVVVGFVAGLILLALALTSTRGWQRRMGQNWKRLHRLVYLAGILAVLHFAWLVKDVRVPLQYGAVLILLLVLRIPRVRKAMSRGRHWLRQRLSRPSPASL
ncbi:MAG: sulfoxide reductase heme-binding subunit YedZ [Anaerolineae bacterium]|nr:sulfoxide reductase heme-binding subunit YedZ [Anaerolineae bacterium]